MSHLFLFRFSLFFLSLLWFYLVLDTNSSEQPFHRTIANRITHNATGQHPISLSEDSQSDRAVFMSNDLTGDTKTTKRKSEEKLKG